MTIYKNFQYQFGSKTFILVDNPSGNCAFASLKSSIIIIWYLVLMFMVYKFSMLQMNCGYSVSWSLEFHNIRAGHFFHSRLPFHPKVGKINKKVHAILDVQGWIHYFCTTSICHINVIQFLSLYWPLHLQQQIQNTNRSAHIVDTNPAGCKNICNFCRGWRKNRYVEADPSFSELFQLLLICNAYCHWEGYVSLATIKHIVNVPEEFLVSNYFSS